MSSSGTDVCPGQLVTLKPITHLRPGPWPGIYKDTPATPNRLSLASVISMVAGTTPDITDSLHWILVMTQSKAMGWIRLSDIVSQ